MRHHRRTLAALAVLAVFSGCQVPPKDLTEADVTAIKAQVDRYVKAAVAADWTAFGNELAPDVIFLPPNSAPVVGHAAVVKYVSEYPRITRFDYKVDEVVGRGDLAYARGSYDLDATLPDKTTITDKGVFLEVHKVQPDHLWKYTHVAWHPSSPPPAPPPAAKKK